MSLLHRIDKKIRIEPEPDVLTTAYINRDTRPLPPCRRTYGPWQFIGLWVVTGSFNIGGWTTGSALIALGLNVWQAMVTVIIGHSLVGLICVLSGGPGAKWHIGFSILQKASWGMRGVYFPLVQRIVLSFVWYSTQVYWGGECVRSFLTALAPSYRKLDTPLANGTMTTGDFVGFIIFSLLCLPVIYVRPERYHIPFAVAACTVIPTMLAIFCWSIVKADGLGPMVHNISIAGVTQARGSHLGWMFILGICTNIGGIATHIFSQSDFTRFARRPRDQLVSQILFVPSNTILVSFIGIVCTSCAAKIFPETQGSLVWAPYDLLNTMQSHYNDSPHARAACAFASLAFILAQLGISVAENALSNGIDMSALAPRYFNLRRGGYVTAAAAFIMQPWQLLNGASKFLTVMGGYGVFLGPMTGVMFADYYIVRRQNLKLTHLYEASEQSIYWYTKGVNWRAGVAWIMGTWCLLPGFVQRVRNPDVEVKGFSHLYYMNWPLGCGLAVLTYWGLHRLFPVERPLDVDDGDYFETFEELDGAEEPEKVRSEETSAALKDEDAEFGSAGRIGLA